MRQSEGYHSRVYTDRPDEAIAELLRWLDGDDHALDNWPEPKLNPHGKVVGYRFESYNDVTIYEDGYEEWEYIGD